MPKGFVQVNTNLTKEDAEMLDLMMQVNGYDNRSAFVRWLIRQEFGRRFSSPQPLVTVAEVIDRPE